MSRPPLVFIALGSNLGDRAAHLRAALEQLGASDELRVLACSKFHETEPVGGPPGQEHYLNAVVRAETNLPPTELLARLQSIEAQQGRQRSVPNAPRTLDLDLLLYHDRVIDEPDLTVPHPRMWSRPFVVEPLREVCTLAELEAAKKLKPPERQEQATDVREH